MECRLKLTKQLCYLHIPKTAGLAFSHHLKSQFVADDICNIRYWFELNNIQADELNRFKLISAHVSHSITQRLEKPPAMLTILRDPIERVLSTYEYLKWFTGVIDGTERDDAQWYDIVRAFREETGGDLLSFLNTKNTILQSVIANTQTMYIAGVDQNALSEMGEDTALKLAKENLKEFAFVGLTEHMQESLELLSFTFGWRPFENTQMNVTPNNNRRNNIPKAAIDLISAQNSLDIELYKFSQELFAKRHASMLADLNGKFPIKSLFVKTNDATPIDLVIKQLEQHYEINYLQNHSLSSCFSKTLGEFAVGAGWWEWETHGESGHRWTGPGTASILDIPLLTNKALRLSFQVVGAATPETLKNVRLRVNSKVVDVNISSSSIITTVIPVDVLHSDKPFVRIELIVDQVVSAKELDSTIAFDRKIGLAIQSIDIHPENKVSTKFFQLHEALLIVVKRLLGK
jgi:Sulfotransferase family